MNKKPRFFSVGFATAFFAALMMMAPGMTSARSHDDSSDSDDNGFSRADAERITRACHEAAEYVNDNHGDTIGFRPVTGRGAWWCAVTNREGDLLSVRASDTLGTPENPMGSDAARLSIRIAVAKAWTPSFSNSEAAVPSKAVGENSRIDQLGAIAAPAGSAGPAPLWGVWATNIFRSFPGKTGLKKGSRHFGVVPFAGGQPIYVCGTNHLVAHGGASGDSVESDDLVISKAIDLAGYCIVPTP